MFAGLFLVPDASMLGYLVNARAGAVCYNIVHSYLLPLGIATLAILSGRVVEFPFLMHLDGAHRAGSLPWLRPEISHGIRNDAPRHPGQDSR
jgi:hypothetical protein